MSYSMKNEVSQSGSELVPSDIRPLINEISGVQVMLESLKKGDKKKARRTGPQSQNDFGI